MKLKSIYSRILAAFPNLKKLTASVFGGAQSVILPCAGLLWALYALDTACAANGWGADSLIGLIISLLAVPVCAGMITYAAGASWEGRRTTIEDAYHLARIRIREILVTGLAAGVLMIAADGLAGMISSLIGIIPALLGWLPVLGDVISAVISAVSWLIALIMEFIAHAALVIGMLALTADGITGRAQAERALTVLRGSRENILYGLGLILVLWIAVGGMYELFFLLPSLPGALICGLLRAALTAVSTAAVSVIYLAERDKQDGMRYHA